MLAEKSGPLVWVLCALSVGCSSTQAPPKRAERTPSPPKASDSKPPSDFEKLVRKLLVNPASYDFSTNPKLLERIQRSPHGYFRFINAAFSQAVCDRLREDDLDVPIVNLHGDAHIEQYAVTELGRGLTDFDDSSRGPAVLDLLRFGVSLALVLRTHAPEADAGAYFRRFLAGYKAALDRPEHAAPEPGWVTTTRAGFSNDRAKYLRWIEGIMKPVPEKSKAGLREALQPYVQAMLKKHRDLDPRYFDVVEIGSLKMGVGSALDEKYLVRIRGPSGAPLNDGILEVKEVRSLEGVACVQGATSSDPFRILLSQARIAYAPYAYLGYIDFNKKKFWIHSWVDNYREANPKQLATMPAELNQTVYDVGFQLGRGHPKIAGEFELQLRKAQLELLKTYEEPMAEAVEALADATVEAWERFTADS